MENKWKISHKQIVLLFGFLFFSLGLLGIVQIGLLEGVMETIPYSLMILSIGIILLIILFIKKLEK
ncbi:MAG: hypothetical protein EU531_05785 [Promethearchaeota archaeon]|nr:MAG: hypothetical protein EU531_05785 [Candidatus Lokiarchaeota archaeon]